MRLDAVAKRYNHKGVSPMDFSTRAIHAGQPADPSTGATITPIFQTSTYTQQGLGENKGYEYSRTGNPTRAALETCLASLENARFGLAFRQRHGGDERRPEYPAPWRSRHRGRRSLWRHVSHLRARAAPDGGQHFSYVEARDVDAYARAVAPKTRMIWAETPTNPLLSLVDIRALGELARARGVTLVVDNTFATPYLQQPLDLGAHVVVHSTTKYINGHSDVVGGAVLTSDDALYDEIKFYQNAAGGVPCAVRRLADAARREDASGAHAPA